jgi:hypothetical protein
VASRFAAPGTIQGALFQVRYALILFYRAAQEDPTASIRIEGLDDIEVRRESGRDLIQTKHHDPTIRISDRSPDLWKTLRIWSDTIRADASLLESTTFVLVTTAEHPKSGALHGLSHAGPSSFQEAQHITSKLSEIAKMGGNSTNKPGYESFLRLSLGDRTRLVTRMRLLDSTIHNVDIADQLERLLRSTVTGAPQLKALVHRLEGWWNRRVAINLKDPEDEIIAQDLFSELRDIADSLGPDTLPPVENIEPFNELTSAAERLTYVRQLRLLKYGDSIVLRAMTDFVRAQRHISEWMREELLLVVELSRYKKTLCDEWQIRFDLMADELQGATSSKRLIDRGKSFFGSIIALVLPIRRDWTDGSIMRGVYHELAEEKHVGWHPNFKDLL